MKRRLAIMAVTWATLIASGAALADSPWKLAGNIGMRQFVVVNPSVSANTVVLKQAIADICNPSQPCMVTFWSQAAAVPKEIPMTKEQQQAIVAQYFRSPVTGYEELRIKCPANHREDVKCLR